VKGVGRRRASGGRALRTFDRDPAEDVPELTGWLTGRVLLVERDEAVARAVGGALRERGLTVEDTDDGELALDRAVTGHFELMIFDVTVPGFLGLEGCRRIRAVSDVPMLIVSARDSELDRVLGLEAGADDYVGKPFSMAELVSRVRAILRRRQLDLERRTTILRVGDIEIDLASQRVVLADRAVSLTPMEFQLLALLAQEPGSVFRPREILRQLWQSEYVVQHGACKTHIANLRHKIERDASTPKRIVTVRGVGYMLRACYDDEDDTLGPREPGRQRGREAARPLGVRGRPRAG
jgi:DNA-binding response OmpR family regulator